MFQDIDTALAAFANGMPDALREIILSLLVPVSVLVPSADTAAPSLTFVGGTPVMSANLSWPVPPRPKDINEVAQRGGESHSGGIRDALEKRIPYAFMAQVDLTKVSEPELPNTGRLLFFYDIATGPWDTSTRAAKVIWDQTSAHEAVEHLPNPALVKAEADWNAEVRAYVYEPPVFDEGTIKILIEAGMSKSDIDAMQNTKIDLPEHQDQRVFFGLKRHMNVARHLQSPTPYNPEWEPFSARVVEKCGNSLTADDLANFYAEAEIEYEYRAPFQLLGLPAPEQDDPRYYAAVPLVLGKQFATHEDWEIHKDVLDAEAQKLRLLFQVSFADWLQQNEEGTVYFMIKDSDLKARNFDAVIPVYQQT